MRPSLPAFALPLSILMTACGGSAAATPAAKDASAIAGGDAVSAECAGFSRALCEKLGSETETCQSLRSVAEWLPQKACAAAQKDMDSVLARVASLRQNCEALADQLCADIGRDGTICDEVKHDLREVPAGHCRALRSRYPEILAQLKEHTRRSQPLAAEEWSALLAGNPAGFGPADAKVTLVEFSDFECPYCSRASETVHRLREAHGDDVRFVFRHFPLPFHPNARLAAAAAVAAHAQGKFWPYHDRLFENQRALERDDLLRYARELGLDMAAFEQSLASEATEAAVEADIQLGRRVRIDGTPTLFIDGRRVSNPTDYDQVESLVQAALED